jgi:hypothetical protein
LRQNFQFCALAATRMALWTAPSRMTNDLNAANNDHLGDAEQVLSSLC